MQHSIKDLWLYPFPEIDVVHTQEPLLPEPELTTPGRCICHERCNSDPHPTPEIRSRG